MQQMTALAKDQINNQCIAFQARIGFLPYYVMRYENGRFIRDTKGMSTCFVL